MATDWRERGANMSRHEMRFATRKRSIWRCVLADRDQINSRTAFTMSAAVRPYLASNSSGLPDSAKVSLMPTKRIGTGWRRGGGTATKRATAPCGGGSSAGGTRDGRGGGGGRGGRDGASWG